MQLGFDVNVERLVDKVRLDIVDAVRDEQRLDVVLNVVKIARLQAVDVNRRHVIVAAERHT